MVVQVFCGSLLTMFIDERIMFSENVQSCGVRKEAYILTETCMHIFTNVFYDAFKRSVGFDGCLQLVGLVRAVDNGGELVQLFSRRCFLL